MQWYYAKDGQAIGPIADVELRRLSLSGVVNAKTLVWHEGMPNWAPWEQVRSAVTEAKPKPALKLRPEDTVCAQCGRQFAAAELYPKGDVRVCGSCFAADGSAGPGQAQDMNVTFGGFWIRFAAKLIDNVVLGGLLGIAAFVAGLLVAGSAARSNAAGVMAAIVLALVLVILLAVAYSVLFVGKFGATPGKMALRLKIVCADGSRVSYGRALGRWCAEQLSNMIFYIGYIIAAFDSEKRALHDRLCDTRVIRL
jgi:uncharacterized RDD family membrane protein YckC